MKSKILAVCALLTAVSTIFPNTASMENIMEDSKEAARRNAGTDTGNLEIETPQDENEVSEGDDGAETFQLKGITIESNIKYIQQENVQHLIEPYIGKTVGITELKQLCEELKTYCRNAGWLATVAYLPEQDSANGVIQIQIFTPNFGAPKINNQSRLADDILNEVGKKISDRKQLTSQRIEDVLYRLNEIGGIKARGALVPNVHTRGIDIGINVENDQTNRGIFYIENYGSKYSGRYRAGLIYDIFNIDNRGSRLEVSGLISNEDLDNYAIDYSIISDRQSTSRLGLSIGKTSYHLTREYEVLDVGGDSIDYRIYGITPIYKTIHDGLELEYAYKFRDVKEHIRLFSLENDRYVHTFSIGFKGYRRSAFNDLFNYSFTVYNGVVSNKSEYAELQDEYTHTSGSFTRSQLMLDYRKLLSPCVEFHSQLTWQNASKTLNSSEKLTLGGANGVRGYADGDSSGDEGYLTKNELVWHTDIPGLSTSLFLDIGGSGNKIEHDIKTIRSWGIGLNYSKPNDFFVRMDYARKIGNNLQVASDDVRQRFWFMVGKIF